MSAAKWDRRRAAKRLRCRDRRWSKMKMNWRRFEVRKMDSLIFIDPRLLEQEPSSYCSLTKEHNELIRRAFEVPAGLLDIQESISRVEDNIIEEYTDGN